MKRDRIGKNKKKRWADNGKELETSLCGVDAEFSIEILADLREPQSEPCPSGDYLLRN